MPSNHQSLISRSSLVATATTNPLAVQFLQTNDVQLPFILLHCFWVNFWQLYTKRLKVLHQEGKGKR